MVRKSSNRRRSKRNTRVLSGKGGYFDKSKAGEVTAIGKALRYIGGLGGGAIAPFAGAHPGAGALAGRTLGGNLSKWLGYGAYKVSRNSIMDSSNASIPMMHSSNQAVIVRHREYIGDILSSEAYAKVLELPLNPGLSVSFPWLSSVAKQYQEYTWRGMVFHYIPTVGEAVSATVPVYGNVMMHTEYRVTAPAPANKAELLNEYFASDARPCEPFIHPIECDPKENPYNVQYVRTGAVPAGEDAKTYDLGMFRTYTQGQAATGSILGEIWVSYEVELRKPQLSSQSGDASIFSGSGTTSTVLPFGTVITPRFNYLSLTVQSSAGLGTITFPKGLAGKFLVTITWNQTGNMTIATLNAVFNGCNVLPLMGSTGTDLWELSLPTAANTGGSFVFAILADGTTSSNVQITIGTLTNSVGSMVAVCRLPM